MVWARNLALAVIVLMVILMANILINDSFMAGIGMDRFIAGLADPWQTFIGFDMMAGLLLMAGWIIYRQSGARGLDTLVWVLLINWWGNIIVGGYILVALAQSRGDPARFFMGARAGPLAKLWRPTPLVRGLCLICAAGSAGYALLSMRALGFSGLPAWAFAPAFAPIVAGFVLLALPANRSS